MRPPIREWRTAGQHPPPAGLLEKWAGCQRPSTSAVDWLRDPPRHCVLPNRSTPTCGGASASSARAASHFQSRCAKGRGEGGDVYSALVQKSARCVNTQESNRQSGLGHPVPATRAPRCSGVPAPCPDSAKVSVCGPRPKAWGFTDPAARTPRVHPAKPTDGSSSVPGTVASV